MSDIGAVPPWSFVCGTVWGELLSLAGSRPSLKKLSLKRWYPHNWRLMGESNVVQFHGFFFVTVVKMSVVTAIAKSSPSHSGINVELAKTFPQRRLDERQRAFATGKQLNRTGAGVIPCLKVSLKSSWNCQWTSLKLIVDFLCIFFYKYKWSVCLICCRIEVRSYDDANRGGIFPTCVKLGQHRRKCYRFQIDLWAFFLVNRDKRTFKGK